MKLTCFGDSQGFMFCKYPRKLVHFVSSWCVDKILKNRAWKFCRIFFAIWRPLCLVCHVFKCVPRSLLVLVARCGFFSGTKRWVEPFRWSNAFDGFYGGQTRRAYWFESLFSSGHTDTVFMNRTRFGSFPVSLGRFLVQLSVHLQWNLSTK